MPEARINLAQATIHLALAPEVQRGRSRAIDAALADVRAGLAGAGAAARCATAHYPGAAKLGHAQRYRYPHDAPEGVVAQQYPPDELVGRDYYQPGRARRRAGSWPNGWPGCGRSSAAQIEPAANRGRPR